MIRSSVLSKPIQNRVEYSKIPLVSVIIPTYKSQDFVVDAVKSVLAQTYAQYEVIVIDDGSTDGTKDMLRRFCSQIVYLRQENRGPSAARNAGIRIANGAYICFLDADDLWTPDKLEIQTAFMEQNRSIGLLFSDHEEFDREKILSRSFLAEKTFRSEIISHRPIREAFAKLVIENFISTPTVMVRRECLEKAGLFDESIRSVEDRDMWLRVSAHFGIACLPLILCKKRIHKGNISREPELASRGRVSVLENNRRRFPNLAPASIWNSQLADAYFQLGYILLAKDQRVEALLAGLRSLTHAMRQIVMNRPSSSYPWIMAFGLIPASLVGWRLARSLWRAQKILLGPPFKLVKKLVAPLV